MIIGLIWLLGSTNPALLSSNEYSTSSWISSTGGWLLFIVPYGIGLCAGVIAVCIGTDTVEGVEGTGIGIALGVRFSSSAKVAFVVLGGVLNDDSSLSFNGGNFFCCDAVSLPCVLFKSSSKCIILDLDDAVEEMGENGFRTIGDSGSLAAPKECFFIDIPPIAPMSKPLLPSKW